METALVCGAGGFIGSHLVKKLRADGYFVRGVDLKEPTFSPSEANEFLLLDLTTATGCEAALDFAGQPPMQVYNLAADMGGMGFIHSAECEIMRNSALININLVHAAAEAGIDRYFFSSSVCVYRDMAPGEPPITEDDAYSARPDNEYGWEKLYAERMAAAYGRRYGLAVRIARFENCYGPEGTWQGGREKAPAAICRKVAAAPDGGRLEVWGDGSAVRSYVYVDDLVEGICALMRSDLDRPANIGTSERVTVDELVQTVVDASGKALTVTHVDGPVGVRARNFSHQRIEALGWNPRISLAEGISRTYHWVAKQVEDTAATLGA